MTPTLPAIKDQLLALAENLPARATWDDVLYEVYVRQSIEQGVADVAAGRTIPVEEVKEYLKQRLEKQRARSLEQ